MTATARVRVMNPGTSREFERAFLTCDDGHDLGNIPVKMLLPEDLARPCRACEQEASR